MEKSVNDTLEYGIMSTEDVYQLAREFLKGMIMKINKFQNLIIIKLSFF